MQNYLDHLQNHILPFWEKYSVDQKRGGFFGKIDLRGKADHEASKGLVQHCRYLWTFSAAYEQFSESRYEKIAKHALDFLFKHFKDLEYGGYFFAVEADGRPLDSRKHVYPHSFVMYAMAEYARVFNDQTVLNEALQVFQLLETKTHDSKFGGYAESFDKAWIEIDQHEDMGIAGKRKSMNSHIHMLEALTTLAKACRANTNVGSVDLVLERLRELVDLCVGKIFNPNRKSLDLFFEKDWTRLPSPTSFGHDIELSWLLEEAAHFLGVVDKTRPVSFSLAENSLKGLKPNSGLLYEGDAHAEKILDSRRVWWVEAEALVGFYNAYKILGNTTDGKRYLAAFENVEKWIFENMVDREFGEWFEEISGDGLVDGQKSLMKGHLWREPYHQSRACLEIGGLL